MIKTTSIFRNINDLDSFQTFYENLFPKIHQLPGIVETNITRVDEQNVAGIQLIIDTFYESEAAMQNVFVSSEAQALMNQVAQSNIAEFYFFIGEEQYIDLRKMRETNSEAEKV
jgi:heme-degrading monooxygenase HmoA